MRTCLSRRRLRRFAALARRAGMAGLAVNLPGAAGAPAADALLAAALDSGTLLLGGLDHVGCLHPNGSRRPFDPLVDLVLVEAPAPHAAQLNAWLVETRRKPEIVPRYRGVAIGATPIGPDATAEMVRRWLREVDAMRLAVFGRTR